jgi:S1-C subfamily serine protease
MLALAARGQGVELSEEKRIALCKTLQRNVAAVRVVRHPQEGEEEVLSRFSGIFLDKEGHIATVADALVDSAEIYVQLFDGRTLEARIVGVDPLMNVGVLHVKAEDLLPVRTGRTETPPVGTRVFAVGNPFGLSHSVSEGMISGTDRTLTGRSNRLMYGFLQTTAPVNPGDAGGLLADSKGRFVGMISSTFGRSPSFLRVRKMLEEMFRKMNQDPEFKELIREISRLFFSGFGGGKPEDLEQKFEALEEKIREKFPSRQPGWTGEGEEFGPRFGAHGINFAVPAGRVLDIARQLIEHKRVIRGRMGVRVLSLKGSPYHRKRFQIPKEVEGVLVAVIDAEGPAGRAGIQRFDVIQTFAGKKVTDPVAMMEKVHATAPGTRVRLKFWRREAGTREVEVLIEELKLR